MKILALTNLYPPHHLGGYELICRTVVNALRRRGHEVDVLTSAHATEAGRAQIEEPGVERALRIHGFYGHPWLGIRELRELEIENNAILRRALAVGAPDLVYVCNLGGLSKSMLFTLQKSGLPTAFYLSDHWIARGLVSDVWLRWWNRRDATLKQRAARAFWTAIGERHRLDATAPTHPIRQLRFRRIYFCSRALRELTVAAGFDVQHGAVIYCPVDTERFAGQVRRADQPIERLLYVGRLAEDKGVITALRALHLLGERFPGRLSIYGRGDADYEKQLRQFAAEKQLRVTFEAAAPAEMPGVYRQHDALIFPSEWEEPFALTPLEAMSCGLPVIATTTGGSAELFRHGKNALTYPAGNFDQLAERILELHRDGRLRESCALGGYCEVRQRCAEKVIMNQVEDYLLETVRSWRTFPEPGEQP